MIEIVINRCPSGTVFSEAGLIEYARRKGLDAVPDPETVPRNDPDLVAMMKEDAGIRVWGGECSHVEIITVPDDFPWKIVRDGNHEWVAADHG
jgi:hypothetical protein